MHERKTFVLSNNVKRLLIIPKIQDALIDWGRQNFVNFPWRNTQNSFHALIAEIMLQRTRAEQVVPVYLEFIQRYSSPLDALNENPDRIRELLFPLGLRWRAEKVIELSQNLAANDCQIPLSLEELMNLPGIGLYAASAYLSFHKKIPHSIVDSNIVRLWGRLFGFITNSDTRRKRWFLELADRITPDTNHEIFNYAILDFTRNICKKIPKCGSCPINRSCLYYDKIGKFRK